MNGTPSYIEKLVNALAADRQSHTPQAKDVFQKAQELLNQQNQSQGGTAPPAPTP